MARKRKEGDNEIFVQRTVQIGQDDWNEMKARASKKGLFISDVIRDLVKQWLIGDVQLSEDKKLNN